MSDEFLNIKLTGREIDLIQQCISTNIETVKRRHDPADCMIAELLTELSDLSIDLLEQACRPGDWNEPEGPEDLSGRTFTVAEDDFIRDVEINAENQMFNAGVEAREKVKATSRAAERRALNFSAPTCDGEQSETQRHDLWNPNDPSNW